MKDAKVECRGVRKRRVKFDRQRKLLSKRLEGVHLEVTPASINLVTDNHETPNSHHNFARY